jgi:D-glucosaminate-6-phosphate ammonia-lyase
MERRDIFRGMGSGLVAAIAARLPLRAAPKASGLYQRIGVRPIVNCKGTYTIISGSQTLPEVKAAMDEGSRHYVNLDELAEAAGRRLAELTRAEWGMVTAGCAAALTHATVSCLVGADPEKLQRLPDLTGLEKNEVVMPRPSRNVYDYAIRMTGAKIVTPETRDEFLAALRPSTAMIALLGETMPKHPMKLEEMAEAARRKGIPILVDAAAERPTIPDVYLTQGADLVAYSGGKCLRGPQCAGLLLGRKDLVQAAWINSAPHHAFGRSMKVGKEEVMGMLAAVEAWTARNHDAEWKQWEGWLETIRRSIEKVPGVTTSKVMPAGPSNYAPQLRISFDPQQRGATGDEMAAALLAGEPRIILHSDARSLTVMPYMMMPGDDRIAAGRIAAILQHPPKRNVEDAKSAAAPAGGQWDVHLDFVRGGADHTFSLEEDDGRIRGQHRGEFLTGDIQGSRQGDRIRLRASHPYEGASVAYTFEGVLSGSAMTGTVDLGEYGKAKFTARRQA